MHADRSQPRDITTKERCSFSKKSRLQQTFAVADAAKNSTALQTHRQKKTDESFHTILQSASTTMQLVSSLGREIKFLFFPFRSSLPNYVFASTSCFQEIQIQTHQMHTRMLLTLHADDTIHVHTSLPPHRFTQETFSIARFHLCVICFHVSMKEQMANC